MAVTLLGSGNGHVSAAYGGDNDIVTTGDINSTGATGILIGASWYQDRGTPVFSDSKSNSYTNLTKQIGDRSTCILAYNLNPTVGASHNFTFTGGVGSGCYPNIFAYIFTGNGVGTPTQNGTGLIGVLTSIQPGAVSPAAGGALIVTVCSVSLTNAPNAIDLSYNISTGYDNESGGAAAYLEQSSPASSNPAWSSFTSVTGVAAAIAEIEAAAAAAGNPWNYYAQL